MPRKEDTIATSRLAEKQKVRKEFHEALLEATAAVEPIPEGRDHWPLRTKLPGKAIIEQAGRFNKYLLAIVINQKLHMASLNPAVNTNEILSLRGHGC